MKYLRILPVLLFLPLSTFSKDLESLWVENFKENFPKEYFFEYGYGYDYGLTGMFVTIEKDGIKRDFVFDNDLWVKTKTYDISQANEIIKSSNLKLKYGEFVDIYSVKYADGKEGVEIHYVREGESFYYILPRPKLLSNTSN